ncbi:MAG: CPBP family intramembrane metalloprotease [Cyanobacteria bacterium SZAS LIN-5]|nr:CPBP family intramembrane metalloprotease [Cyanobacteria bacterium SZAS LIN-5]
MQTNRPNFPLKSIFSKDVIFLTVLGLALLVFSVCRRDDAFPAASLDLKVTKKEAVALAQAYAETTGFSVPNKIISSSYFSSDNEAATFLEYEYPLSEANELMRKEVPIWHWKVHLLDGKNDEVQVWIGVNGGLHSFERDLNKDRPAKSISHDEAKQIVAEYAAREMQIDLSDWKLISDEQSRLPRRIDHTFTWENSKRDLHGGHLQLNAVVSGDRLSKFTYYLHVPDTFQQKFKWLRAQNRALANISFIFMFLFALWLPVIFLRRWTKGQLRMKFAVIGGLVAASVAFISNLHDAATIVAGTSNWSMETFLAKHFLNGLSAALLAGLICTIFVGAVETVYRKAFPTQPAFELFFTQTTKVFRSIAVAKSAILGLAVFGITTGYQVIFFLVGKHYGLWFPLAVHDRGIIDDFLPAWHAISIGTQASTLEELGFRIFILVIIQRTTKSFWIANILQATIWAFAHSTYAVEPPYARGIELGLLGIFYGWMLRRYGVLCLLLGHYAFDSYLTIQTLFGSHDLIDWTQAFFALTPVVIIPLLALLLILRRGSVPDEEVSNEHITANLIANAQVTSKQEMWPPYRPIEKKQILWAVLFALIAGTSMMLPKTRLGDDPMLRVNHEQAISIARDYFARRGFPVTGSLSVAWLSDDTDPEQIQYLAQHLSFERAQQLEHLIEPRLVWNVRLFKPADPKVLYLKIGPDGTPVSATISVDEMTPGAKLEQSQATEIANNYFQSLEKSDIGQYKIFDTLKLEHPNRIDYIFTAQNSNADIGQARFQISFKLIGNQISDVKRYWAMPDDHTKKKRSYATANDVWILVAKLVTGLVVIPNLAYWIFCICKRQPPNRYLVSSAVIIAATLSLLEQANYMGRAALWSYNPTEPMDTHLLSVAFGGLTRTALDVSVAAVLAAIVSSSYPGLFVSNRLRELLKSAKPQISNYRIWSDAILIGFTAAIVCGGLMSTNEFVVNQVSHSVLITKLHHIPLLEQTSLTMTSLLDALKYGLLFVLAGAAILRWSDFCRNPIPAQASEQRRAGSPLVVPVCIAMVICVANLSSNDPQRSICNIAANLGLALSLYVVLKILGNGNLLACFFTAFFLTIGKDIYYLQKNAAFIHPVDLMTLYGLLIAPFLWLILCLILEFRNNKPTPEQLPTDSTIVESPAEEQPNANHPDSEDRAPEQPIANHPDSADRAPEQPIAEHSAPTDTAQEQTKPDELASGLE